MLFIEWIMRISPLLTLVSLFFIMLELMHYRSEQIKDRPKRKICMYQGRNCPFRSECD